MKKIVSVLIALISVLFYCVSCDSSDDNTSKPEELDRTNFDSESSGLNSSDHTSAVKSEPNPDYSDKTRLVYLFPGTVKEETACAINEYLDEMGSPYIVEFQDREKDYADLRGFLKGADLIFTGIGNSSYLELANENAILCLDEYLLTEEGDHLYQSLPASNWYAVTVGNSVYGATGYPFLLENTGPSYTVNRELMNKYGITEADLRKPLYELDDVIQTVYEGERWNDEFTPVRISFSNYDHFSGEFRLSSGVKMNEETEQAHLLIDNPEYVRWLRCIVDFSKSGYLQNSDEIIDNMFLDVHFSTRMPTELASSGRYLVQGDITGKAMDIAVDGYDNYSGQTAIGVVAVSANSTNQAYALDLLTRIFTDSHLTNLMAIGDEYEDMLDSDGRLKPEYSSDASIGFANYFISAPAHYDYADMNERSFEFHNRLLKSNFTGFFFDSTLVSEQISDTDLQFSSLISRALRSEEDFDTFILNIRQQMMNAGAQQIIEEANRQFGDFKAREGSE